MLQHDLRCNIVQSLNLIFFLQDTYGHYAELLHKINRLSNSKSENYKDLMAQRDFMDFVCRSFANRLERRRNLLITSARFFRLVAEVNKHYYYVSLINS